MIKVCRLSISYKNDSRDMKTVLSDAMQEVGITMNDTEVNGPDYGNKTHFGNWVLTPVLDNAATAKLAAALETKTDMHRQIIEISDIQAIPEGKKVKINFMSDFGFNVASEGKVLRKSGNEITILKKGSRSKGWSFRPWDEVTIEAY